MLSTLILPDSGEARIFGIDAVRQPRAAQRMMNRVSVEASFFKKLSAWENLLYSSKFYGVSQKPGGSDSGRVGIGPRLVHRRFSLSVPALDHAPCEHDAFVVVIARELEAEQAVNEHVSASPRSSRWRFNASSMRACDVIMRSPNISILEREGLRFHRARG